MRKLEVVERHWRMWMLGLVPFLAAAAPLAVVSGAFMRGSSVPWKTVDSEDVALALSAAPSTLTPGADVYAWHDDHYIKARTGTSGVACIVSRDKRLNGVFPMCFDPEGAHTLMQEEMMKTELFAQGLSDSTVQQRVDAAYADGTLHHPDKPAITYMMSSRQNLINYQTAGDKSVGAWHPHVMIYLPHTSADQFALGAESNQGPVSIPFGDAGGSQMVIQVPHWADK